jgi:hypothetical protein
MKLTRQQIIGIHNEVNCSSIKEIAAQYLKDNLLVSDNHEIRIKSEHLSRLHEASPEQQKVFEKYGLKPPKGEVCKQGDFIESDGEKYLLCQVDAKMAAAINLGWDIGNRERNAIRVKDITAITPEEMEQIVGTNYKKIKVTIS